MLSRIASKKILFIAEDTIDCVPCTKKRVTRVLTDNDDDNTRIAGLSKQIIIKIGVKVMIRRNIDASLGLVNGTNATIILIVHLTIFSLQDNKLIKIPQKFNLSIKINS